MSYKAIKICLQAYLNTASVEVQSLLGEMKPKGLNMKKLVNDGVVTPNTSVIINNDRGNVSLSTIDKICNYLSDKLGRPIKIEEILEFIPDAPGE